jgi:signal transduction histidine kinase
MILAVQLRESVVSIDVAVPLLADPMKLDRAQGAAFDQVRRHARGLTRLANDLLTLDQMDTRKMALTMVPVDLAAFVLEITEQRVPHDRATIIAPSTPVQVNADPERLRQLLDHVLQNALKFSPPSAGIMVNVSAGGDEARVAIRDHGVGLSAEDMPVLFTRYGRIRDARTANVPGMGLGLYLAKLIAEAHGGELLAASQGRGLGATFTLVLPLAGHPRRQRPQRQLPASSFWD